MRLFLKISSYITIGFILWFIFIFIKNTFIYISTGYGIIGLLTDIMMISLNIYFYKIIKQLLNNNL